MRKKPTLEPLVLFGFGAMALVVASLPAAAQTEVKVGFNYPKSGPYANEGLDELSGAELAEVEINKEGGILGNKIKLIPRDLESKRDGSKSREDAVRENATDLIKDGAKMIFGGISSEVDITVGEAAHKNNVIFFSTMGASMDITGKDGYITTFRECSDAYMAARMLGTYLLREQSEGKYFYILVDYNWGWTTEAVVRAKSDTLDVKVHERATIPLKATGADIKAKLEQAKRAHPDVLVLILFGEQFVKAIRIADELGLNKSHKVQIVAPSLTTTMAEQAGASLMEGVIGVTFWDWSVPDHTGSAEGKVFVQRFVKKYNRYPSSPAASAYTILRQYKAAVERAKTFETNRVIRELEGWKYSLLRGEQQWRTFDHQSIQSVYLIEGRPKNEVDSKGSYFTVKGQAGVGEVGIPELKWIGDRLYNGKSPRLD